MLNYKLTFCSCSEQKYNSFLLLINFILQIKYNLIVYFGICLNLRVVYH